MRRAREVAAVDEDERAAVLGAAVDREGRDGGRRHVRELHVILSVRLVVERHLDRHRLDTQVGAGVQRHVCEVVAVKVGARPRAEAKHPLLVVVDAVELRRLAERHHHVTHHHVTIE